MSRRRRQAAEPTPLDVYRRALAAKRWCDKRLADAHVELETATREQRDAQAELNKARLAWEASEQ